MWKENGIYVINDEIGVHKFSKNLGITSKFYVRQAGEMNKLHTEGPQILGVTKNI